MTPDRMRGWLAKAPAGALAVELLADTPNGLVELATWDRSEIEDLKGQADGDVATAMIGAAQEYADGEETRQKFLIRWRGKRAKCLKSITHWARPNPTEARDLSPGISDATIIRDLLRANNEKDKVLLSALTASAAAYERTITMLSTRLQQAYETIDESKGMGISSAPVVVEVSAIAEAEIMQRTAAMKALTDKLPDVIDLAVTAMANKLLENEPTAKAAAAAAELASANGGH